jgi:16S rRNA (guanine527-N7)-methyltransferase
LKTEVWAARVEGMAAGRQFDVVALRAVDNMEAALAAARVRARGWLVVLTTERAWIPQEEFAVEAMVPLPGSADGVVVVAKRG